jgi:hypothetical protein
MLCFKISAMQTQSKEPTGILNQIRIIHYAMVAGVTIFLVACLYLTLSGSIQLPYDPALTNTLFLLTAAMTVMLLPVGYLLFKRQIMTVEKDISLIEKMAVYKRAFIVKMGLIEAPAFFSTIVLLLTGNRWLLVQIVAVLLVMIINRPSAEKIASLFSLDRSMIQDIKEI